jgi:acylphosphatase
MMELRQQAGFDLMSTEVDRIEMKVSGRVQGVSFRYYTRREAIRLGLTGWVRNELDGSVLIVAEGDREKLENLLMYAHRGPPGAIVEKIQPKWFKGSREFSSFEVRWL